MAGSSVGKYLEIKLEPCTGEGCAPQTEIEYFKNNTRIMVLFIGEQVDMKNQTDPMKQRIKPKALKPGKEATLTLSLNEFVDNND